MRLTTLGMLVGVLLLVAGPAFSADQDRDRDRDRQQDRIEEQQRERTEEQLRERETYGWQLMTPEERNTYQNRMRAATTEQERNTIRNEHHERMRERARAQGVTLPEEPGKWGKGDGMGAGGGGRGGK